MLLRFHYTDKKPFKTKAYDRRASGDCGTSGLVCLSVCLFVCLLSTLTFAFELLDRYFIFIMHTPLMTPFQMTPLPMTADLDFDLEATNSFLDFMAAGGIVFHKHTLIF